MPDRAARTGSFLLNPQNDEAIVRRILKLGQAAFEKLSHDSAAASWDLSRTPGREVEPAASEADGAAFLRTMRQVARSQRRSSGRWRARATCVARPARRWPRAGPAGDRRRGDGAWAHPRRPARSPGQARRGDPAAGAGPHRGPEGGGDAAALMDLYLRANRRDAATRLKIRYPSSPKRQPRNRPQAGDERCARSSGSSHDADLAGRADARGGRVEWPASPSAVSERHHVKSSSFDRWVNDNNILDAFEYARSWWDYIELVRRFAFRLDAEDVRVVGRYVVDTPPPCEHLPMPAVAIDTPSVTFALRYDFGSWSLKHPESSEWVVSVQRRSPYRGPLFGLFDPALDLRLTGADGLAPDFLFGSYHHDQARFSCILRDEWDVSTLMRIVSHEA